MPEEKVIPWPASSSEVQDMFTLFGDDARNCAKAWFTTKEARKAAVQSFSSRVFASRRNFRALDKVIVLMYGPTGAGKSSFINDLLGTSLKVGDGTSSKSKDVERVAVKFQESLAGSNLKYNHTFCVDDTPGLFDTKSSDRPVNEAMLRMYAEGLRMEFPKVPEVDLEPSPKIVGSETVPIFPNLIFVCVPWSGIKGNFGIDGQPEAQEDSELPRAIESLAASGLVDDAGRGNVIVIVTRAMSDLNYEPSEWPSEWRTARDKKQAIVRSVLRQYLPSCVNACVSFTESRRFGARDFEFKMLPDGAISHVNVINAAIELCTDAQDSLALLHFEHLLGSTKAAVKAKQSNGVSKDKLYKHDDVNLQDTSPAKRRQDLIRSFEKERKPLQRAAAEVNSARVAKEPKPCVAEVAERFFAGISPSANVNTGQIQTLKVTQTARVNDFDELRYHKIDSQEEWTLNVRDSARAIEARALDFRKSACFSLSLGKAMEAVALGCDLSDTYWSSIGKDRSEKRSASIHTYISHLITTEDDLVLCEDAKVAAENLPPFESANPAIAKRYLNWFEQYGATYIAEIRLGGRIVVERTYRVSKRSAESSGGSFANLKIGDRADMKSSDKHVTAAKKSRTVGKEKFFSLGGQIDAAEKFASKHNQYLSTSSKVVAAEPLEQAKLAWIASVQSAPAILLDQSCFRATWRRLPPNCLDKMQEAYEYFQSNTDIKGTKDDKAGRRASKKPVNDKAHGAESSPSQPSRSDIGGKINDRRQVVDRRLQKSLAWEGVLGAATVGLGIAALLNPVGMVAGAAVGATMFSLLLARVAHRAYLLHVEKREGLERQRKEREKAEASDGSDSDDDSS